MKLQSLQDLFEDQLKDLYSAENQLVKALPKVARAASSPELRGGFEEHMEQARNQVECLERICEQLDVTPRGKKCVAMKGLIEEGKELLEEDASPSVLDAGLIAAAQKVEYYEIASYGTARTWAQLLGHLEAVALLEETLQEEKATDEKLTELAEQTVNEEAEVGGAESGAGTSRKAKGRGRRAR